MSKQKNLLENMMRNVLESAEPVAAAPKKARKAPAAAPKEKRDNVVTLQRDNAKTSQRLQHTSLYLPPEVRRAIREIAFQYDRKPHDLYMEGINLMLAQYGKPDAKALSSKK